ncbi:zinc finger protein [Actinopolyspora sp. H202]|uniref:zinc finger protein n=1 Tax=Actinopolyspora sp. H202 TaxID=1500456 RepID=UPI003EE4CFEA
MTSELKHHWQPAEKQRHAIAGPLPRGKQHDEGESLDTLCGKRVVAAASNELNWLWPTCDACMGVAKERVGATA